MTAVTRPSPMLSVIDPPGDVLIVIRNAVRQRRYFDALGATKPERVLLLLALGFRNDDQRPVTARVGDDCKSDPCVAGGAFQDQTTWLQVAAPLGFEDH